MMKFGLYVENKRIELIDLATGEILAESKDSIQAWLRAYENNYTLELI